MALEMLVRLLLLAALFSGPVVAAQTRDCDTFDANASNVDWSEPTRTFANGNIRLIKLDIEEPACCAKFLMILHPKGDDPFLGCTLVGRSEGFGWNELHLMDAHASYDPQRGLTVAVQTSAFDGSNFVHETVRITINQAMGSVEAE